MKNNKKIKKKIYIFIILFFFTQISFAETIPIYEISGKKIFYLNNQKLIIAEGNATANDKFGKKISANKIIYDKDKLLITTETDSIYKDNSGNTLLADKILYDLNTKILSAIKNVRYLDSDGNIFYFSKLKYFELTKKGIGENFYGKLKDKSSLDGLYAEFDNNLGLLTIGQDSKKPLFEKFFNLFSSISNSYTPCIDKNLGDLKKLEKIDDKCPDWHIKSSKTIHDKNNKMLYHYGSLIKIKNIPVFYTPYFSHPDPSVKRKSGFLPPSIKNYTNLGQSFKTPYYHILNNNTDLTLAPIYYFDESPLFLLEFRQQNKRNKFYIDTSYTSGYKNLNKVDDNGNNLTRTSGSRSHFFFNLLGNYDNLFFLNNDIEINIQRISQKNYLSAHQINTENLKQDISSLKNNIVINSYENNKKISMEASILENLDQENKSQKYQYIFPSISFSNFFQKFNQYLNVNNSLRAENTQSNSKKIYISNILNSTSSPIRYEFFNGLSNTFKTSINNINNYNNNIQNEKENFSSDIFFTGGLESVFPLIKSFQKNEQILYPKVFAKYTTGKMKNAQNNEKLLTYSDIFSMNRMNDTANPETGLSIGYGIDYTNENKNKFNEIYQKSSFRIGQVLKPKKSNEMPIKSTLQNTRSSFVGSADFVNNFQNEDNFLNDSKKTLKVNYEYQISNNLNKLYKNNLKSSLDLNKNTFNIDYYETNTVNDEHYGEFKFSRRFDHDINFSSGIRRNFKDGYTENNFIEINYETDCIKIALNLIKNFYQNEEIKPSNNLSLSLVLKPFGSPVSQNLSSFVN